jgi:outer membrane lipoprotein-sorting protein
VNNKRNIWIFIGVVVFIAALVSGFILMQPTAEEILTQTIDSMESIDSAHAIVDLRVDTPEKDASATVEVWGRQADEGPGAFRMQVLDTSEIKAVDALVVSDGETVWVHSPQEEKVFVGTVEEAKIMLADMKSEYGDFYKGDLDKSDFDKGEFDKSDYEKPESSEQAVQKLLEYFTLNKLGTEEIDNQPAHLLELVPIPDQMPTEYAAVGGLFHLWIDQARNVPLALEYTGGSFGEASITFSDLDLNPELSDTLFTFEIPPDVELVSFADLTPQSLSLEEAAAAAEFEFLTPDETPQGATLVDVLDVRGTIVQRFTLPDGGSFTVAQGITDEVAKPPSESQIVEVRGVEGTLYVSEDGDKVLLSWSEGDLFYYIAGDLTPDQALTIAESLR